MTLLRAFYLLLPIGVWSCYVKPELREERASIDLSGVWQLQLDPNDAGVSEKWYQVDFSDSVQLPGTLDTNQKGVLNQDTTTMHLNRLYKYEGAAWYRKRFVVPAHFEDKNMVLILERTKSTQVWIDSILVGGSHLLQSAQQFDLSTYLTSGEHTITIRVDNSLKLTPYGNVHIYSDDTQTNWNGIIGVMKIEAREESFIDELQVYPDIQNQKIAVKVAISGVKMAEKPMIQLQAEVTENGVSKMLNVQSFAVTDEVMTLEYPISESQLWDEYEQPLYELTATLISGEERDVLRVPFGMRQFEVNGTQFQINGRKTFLRGKHEAGVFPITGYTPTDIESWRRVYKIAKTYGINHYRFHSYCPPDAAFAAADREGIYLQVELPFWGGMDNDTVAQAQRAEGMAMLRAFANHPSFVMFSPGNEIWSGHDRVEANIKALKALDPRPLYTLGSNNNIGYTPPTETSEFFVAARTPYAKDGMNTDSRLTHAFADAPNGGLLNTQVPSTLTNFNYAVSSLKIPLVSHEIGQYQIYPNYDEIEKYTGVLKAWNLSVFRSRLEKKGMLDQDQDFQRATGAWSALCYKAEMEAALRTRGMAGFQLLDLQDFPGQGTALVGVVDAFMDSKGVVTSDVWKQSCNDVVLLLEFPKYCWTAEETFGAEVLIANYSNQSFDQGIGWEIKDEAGKAVKAGNISAKAIAAGELIDFGKVNVPLADFAGTQKLTISITLSGTAYKNEYPIWVYPSAKEKKVAKDIFITQKWNKAVYERLQKGEKVLLFPTTKDVADRSFAGHFPPEFWNYGMFKGISEWVKKPVSPGTLGLIMDPKHPLLAAFPTDYHTNWQWFSIIKASNSLILDKTPNEYRPIVQVVDNLERNHKLGLIFEFKVGAGKLLVCMSRLDELTDKPEAAQLYRSILDYMNADAFNPKEEIDFDHLTEIL
jgi:hypothetical protein